MGVFLKKKIEEKRIELVDMTDKLVLGDAPKIKYTINSGKRIGLEEFKGWIEEYERDQKI